MKVRWWFTFLVLLFFRSQYTLACTTPAFSRDIFETHEQFWQSSDSRVQTQTVWRNRLAALGSSALYYKAFTLHQCTLLHPYAVLSGFWCRGGVETASLPCYPEIGSSSHGAGNMISPNTKCLKELLGSSW